MVVFALVNSGNSGGYYVASKRTSMGMGRGLPHDLDGEINDAKQKGEEVEEVSIGLDGDWFLRTDRRHACKTLHDQVRSISNVELFVQLAQKGGMDLANYAIQFFSFVPDTTGYVTVFHKVDGSLTQCAWHNVPPKLDGLLEREASKGVRQVAVGMNGSYVVILNTGVVWWNGVPEPLSQLLWDAEKKGRRIVTVALSLIAADWFFIEFADGATDYTLPPDWHASVDSYTTLAARNNGPKIATTYNPGPLPPSSPSLSNGPKIATTYNPRPLPPSLPSLSNGPKIAATYNPRPLPPSLPSLSNGPKTTATYNPRPLPPSSPSLSPRSTQPRQPGSFSPVSPSGSSSGYKPFVSDPYPAPVFTGATPPTFASPPPPVFASPPPPASASPPHSTYGVTNVYNTVPQQQPQAAATSQNNGLKVQLLGGAIKVASSLLVPMLRAHVGLGTSTGGSMGGFDLGTSTGMNMGGFDLGTSTGWSMGDFDLGMSTGGF